MFTAEGVRCAEELLRSPVTVRSAVTSPSIRDTERGAALESELRKAAGARGFAVADVSDPELASAADTDTPQGIIMVAEQPERSFESVVPSGIILVLDAVQDPGNVGTILRTAAAFGVTATVALPGTVDLWNPKVVRSAMGALFSHHAFHATLGDTLAFLRAHAVPLWMTSAAGEPIQRGSAGQAVAIVVGNEGSGVSDELAAAAARIVAVPIREVESLNVAVATGIMLYALTTT